MRNANDKFVWIDTIAGNDIQLKGSKGTCCILSYRYRQLSGSPRSSVPWLRAQEGNNLTTYFRLTSMEGEDHKMNYPKKALLSTLAALIVITTLPTSVRAQQCDVCNSGCTYSSIQAAIDNASPGSTIDVCAGDYDEAITIDSAITVQSTDGPENTSIFNYNTNRSVVTFNSNASGAVLDGFTITGQGYYQYSGVTVNSSSPTIANCTIKDNLALDGGGIMLVYASPTISGCTIKDNEAGNGGGIYSLGSSPIIENTDITGHKGVTRGGGLYIDPGSNVTINGGMISGNEATAVSYSGGGVYCFGSMTMTGTSVTDNDANHHGGGIAVVGLGSTAVTISDAHIEGNNVVYDHGGGIYVSRKGDLTVDHSFIRGNTAKNNGGGIYSEGTLTVDNCVISGNAAGGFGYGGGLYAIGTATNVEYTTISGNKAYSGGGIALWGALSNSIVYFNEPSNVYGPAVMNDSDVQGYPNPANNVIDIDPLFRTPPGPDPETWIDDWRIWYLRQQAGSPCIDAGTGTGTFTDIEGIERPQPTGGSYDMGAYEHFSSIDITKALYNYVNDSLEIEATSPNGASDGLVLLGFGADRPMTWDLGVWRLTISWTPAPEVIKICNSLGNCRIIE